MARNKMGLSFSGFEEMSARLESLGGELKSTVTECLDKTNAHISQKLHDDMKRHHRTGNTEASLSDREQVEWNGAVGSVKVGFNIRKGGLPSVFLMYGTPRMKKDTKLYNDIYGRQTSDEVQALQETVFRKKFDEVMGGG